jgi:hypothetical protein
MRKLSIIAVLILGMSIAASAQDLYHANATRVGKWNTSTESYEWDKTEPADLKIIVQSNVILINNKSQTALRLGKKIMDQDFADRRQNAWRAVD